MRPVDAHERDYVLARSRTVHVWHGDVFECLGVWELNLRGAGIGGGLNWIVFAKGELVSQAPSTKCYRFTLPNDRIIYFKRYTYPFSRWHEFWLRPGKAAVEFWAYSRLQQLGIPTLNVIAFGESRRWGALQASCIVTEGVDQTLDLAMFVKIVWSQWPREKRSTSARAIAHRLLIQARKAHDAGFFHHDLKFRNILIRPDGEPETLVWIDAPRARACGCGNTVAW